MNRDRRCGLAHALGLTLVSVALVLPGCSRGAGAAPPRTESFSASCCASDEKDSGGPSPSRTRAPAVRSTGLRAKTEIPDVELVDQDGNRHRFYSDLVKGKLVLMNAIYTTCVGTCPIQSSIFSGVQHRLGSRVGKDVTMISVTLDPVTDTPARLKAFAERYGAHVGWYFLTGKKMDVDSVLDAMGLDAPRPEEHTPIAAIGNEATGVWMKVINLSSPEDIVKKLAHVEALDPAKAFAR